MKLALLLALAACSSEKPVTATHVPSPPREEPRDASPPAMLAANGLLVTAVVDDWKATKATLRLWSRDENVWTPVTPPWDAVIGAGGSAWGAGMHGVGPPDGRSGPVKVEGDRKNPAGAFALTGAYGYAKDSAGGLLPYQQTTNAWKCVDDPSSRAYNRILDEETVTKDWTSAEEMRRTDALYTWVVEVGHNPTHTPRAGSCIFLHVWGGPDSSTVGCTAMAEADLARLIRLLTPTRHPAFVLLPRAEYQALARTWGLPPI